MQTSRYIVKRILLALVSLFAIITITYFLMNLMPGDPFMSEKASEENGAILIAKYGLDQPVFVQYILYIKNLLHLDLGTSIRTNKPVLDELARCYPATIELALFAIILAALLGILFGVISAMKRNSILDQVVRALSVTGVSIPSFWFALLVLYFFYYKLHIFPGPGRLINSFYA